MRILITAGGTTEKIDNVRAITNHSTGALGQAIAKVCLAKDITIDYVTTSQAKKPTMHPRLNVIFIEGTHDLMTVMADLLATYSYDAVIHSMAVSDFTPAQSFSQEDFLASLNELLPRYQKVTDELIQELLHHRPASEKKISSDTEHLFLVLKKTPKIIQMIKQQQPETKLVGFKLLVDVSQEELFQVAENSRQKSQSDYVLANDLTTITGDRHVGYLLDQKGLVGVGQTKAEIATLIVEALIKDFHVEEE